MTLSERYREQAKWARANAEAAPAPELRARWLDIAEQYDRLASEREDTDQSSTNDG